MVAILIGAPVGDGAGKGGCEAGPRALRAAGLRAAIAGAGRAAVDRGDLSADGASVDMQDMAGLKALPGVAAWARSIRASARAMPADALPVFLGGDHCLSLGTLPGLAERAARLGRPFFTLWIDAHPDCHTLATTTSGHLHGTPVAHALGCDGFDPHFAPVSAPLAPQNLLMLGLRSIDAAEERLLKKHGIAWLGPAAIGTHGVEGVLAPFLDRIVRANGLLHVSLDADAIDPTEAPGVGTPVPGGLSFATARRICEAVAAAGMLGSMDLVEVNPFLDRHGDTARAMSALAAAALTPAAVARAEARS